MKTTNAEAQQWWSNLNNGERRLICTLVHMLSGPRLCRRPAAATLERTQHSLLKELIRAAAKWETGIGCFLKLRIIHQRPFRLAPNSPWLRVQGKPDHNSAKKPTANPVHIPIRWDDDYLPRRRNLCRHKPLVKNLPEGF